MNQSTNLTDNLPNVLNASQLASALGISRAGAYNLLGSKGFPTLRIGGRKLVSKQHLAQWIEKQVAAGGEPHA